MCYHALPARAVTRETLQGAMAGVGDQANEIGVLLATLFGGSTPFEEDDVDSDAERDVA